jgi:hypothetical protein
MYLLTLDFSKCGDGFETKTGINVVTETEKALFLKTISEYFENHIHFFYDDNYFDDFIDFGGRYFIEEIYDESARTLKKTFNGSKIGLGIDDVIKALKEEK